MGIEGFFIEHDGWIVKSIVHKMMAKYQDKQEECMNDIFLAVWKNVDRYTGEKASFRTWLTAVARYQVLSHIRDIRYHDYVSLDDVEPVGDSDVKSRLFDEEEMLEFQKLLEILSEEDRQIFTALFWHEKSYEEVGQEMNMPVDRVYSRVSRGKKKLKKNNSMQYVKRKKSKDSKNRTSKFLEKYNDRVESIRKSEKKIKTKK